MRNPLHTLVFALFIVYYRRQNMKKPDADLYYSEICTWGIVCSWRCDWSKYYLWTAKITGKKEWNVDTTGSTQQLKRQSATFLIKVQELWIYGNAQPWWRSLNLKPRWCNCLLIRDWGETPGNGNKKKRTVTVIMLHWTVGNLGISSFRVQPLKWYLL